MFQQNTLNTQYRIQGPTSQCFNRRHSTLSTESTRTYLPMFQQKTLNTQYRIHTDLPANVSTEDTQHSVQNPHGPTCQCFNRRHSTLSTESTRTYLPMFQQKTLNTQYRIHTDLPANVSTEHTQHLVQNPHGPTCQCFNRKHSTLSTESRDLPANVSTEDTQHSVQNPHGPTCQCFNRRHSTLSTESTRTYLPMFQQKTLNTQYRIHTDLPANVLTEDTQHSVQNPHGPTCQCFNRRHSTLSTESTRTYLPMFQQKTLNTQYRIHTDLPANVSTEDTQHSVQNLHGPTCQCFNRRHSTLSTETTGNYLPMFQQKTLNTQYRIHTDLPANVSTEDTRHSVQNPHGPTCQCFNRRHSKLSTESTRTYLPMFQQKTLNTQYRIHTDLPANVSTEDTQHSVQNPHGPTCQCFNRRHSTLSTESTRTYLPMFQQKTLNTQYRIHTDLPANVSTEDTQHSVQNPHGPTCQCFNRRHSTLSTESTRTYLPMFQQKTLNTQYRIHTDLPANVSTEDTQHSVQNPHGPTCQCFNRRHSTLSTESTRTYLPMFQQKTLNTQYRIHTDLPANVSTEDTQHSVQNPHGPTCQCFNRKYSTLSTESTRPYQCFNRKHSTLSTESTRTYLPMFQQKTLNTQYRIHTDLPANVSTEDTQHSVQNPHGPTCQCFNRRHSTLSTESTRTYLPMFQQKTLNTQYRIHTDLPANVSTEDTQHSVQNPHGPTCQCFNRRHSTLSTESTRTYLPMFQQKTLNTQYRIHTDLPANVSTEDTQHSVQNPHGPTCQCFNRRHSTLSTETTRTYLPMFQQKTLNTQYRIQGPICQCFNRRHSTLSTETRDLPANVSTEDTQHSVQNPHGPTCQCFNRRHSTLSTESTRTYLPMFQQKTLNTQYRIHTDLPANVLTEDTQHSVQKPHGTTCQCFNRRHSTLSTESTRTYLPMFQQKTLDTQYRDHTDLPANASTEDTQHSVQNPHGPTCQCFNRRHSTLSTESTRTYLPMFQQKTLNTQYRIHTDLPANVSTENTQHSVQNPHGPTCQCFNRKHSTLSTESTRTYLPMFQQKTLNTQYRIHTDLPANCSTEDTQHIVQNPGTYLPMFQQKTLNTQYRIHTDLPANVSTKNTQHSVLNPHGPTCQCFNRRHSTLSTESTRTYLPMFKQKTLNTQYRIQGPTCQCFNRRHSTLSTESTRTYLPMFQQKTLNTQYRIHTDLPANVSTEDTQHSVQKPHGPTCQCFNRRQSTLSTESTRTYLQMF
ncbi:hypothetical protein Bpfe_029494 [Biomphalaria pfeifferi]|uniref:Uncharacterized protein n=1 Tax=Biomphalaria pfeifferi TaxID=112525 RepID=A0AAD8EUP7_BIOPF|nr:hypothetical protein Bpfe_029494 [Biomphalaria pfeifferi]